MSVRGYTVVQAKDLEHGRGRRRGSKDRQEEDEGGGGGMESVMGHG